MGERATTCSSLTCPRDRRHPAHLFHLVFPDPRRATGSSRTSRERGILAVFHYLPLHVSPMGVSYGGRPGDCPVSESVAARLVRLPLFTDLSRAEQDEVIDAVLGFS